MSRLNHLALCLLLAWLIRPAIVAADEQSNLRLTLPPVAYAVAGQETAIYFDNIVLTEHLENYTFAVTCDLGKAEARRWVATPAEGDAGDHPLAVAVRQGDKTLAEARMTLRVVPAAAGKDRPLALLVVGDSLTHATLYPNEIARLMAQLGNPKLKMLGTHRPANAAEGVAHEGYGGWTWERFVRHYDADPSKAPGARSSPFVFLTGDQPKLDVARYLRERGGGQAPQAVTFLLGINDCFSANPDDPAAIDARIDQVFQHAETLLTAFREAAPAADLGICLTTPPNAREEGFEANYKGRYHRWGWKRIQHRLVQRELKHFGSREDEHVFIVPTQLNLDPVDGYPPNNGVHPNAAGYAQIGGTIHAWLKWRASEWDKK